MVVRLQPATSGDTSGASGSAMPGSGTIHHPPGFRLGRESFYGAKNVSFIHFRVEVLGSLAHFFEDRSRQAGGQPPIRSMVKWARL
jgi:hypothetical protein